jgi:hypothetical protein
MIALIRRWRRQPPTPGPPAACAYCRRALTHPRWALRYCSDACAQADETRTREKIQKGRL